MAYFDIADHAGIDKDYAKRHRPLAIVVRDHAFRERVAQFRRCHYRRPALGEMRTLWRTCV